MSLKNPTRGQQRSAYDYEHNSGMSKQVAIEKAVSQKGPDQPRSNGGWQGFEQNVGQPNYGWASQDDDE